MNSSFRQWEADPLFSAAEVVQDSADRMDSIFRLLLHEQCLAQEHHPDPKFLRSIEYYRRDLATAVETAKWQLEDFERELNFSAKMDQSHSRENVISRHRQFVRAIREQIHDVEKTLRDTSADDLVKGTMRVTLHEEDRNELALFLSGDSAIKHIPAKDFDDTNSMIRFLNPASSSNLNCEFVGHNSEENLHSNSNKYFEASSSLQQAPYEMNEIGLWDVEANKEASRSFFDEKGSRVYNSRIKIFGSLPALWFTYGSRASRSFTKRWKDGEEQKGSQHHTLQGNCRILSLSSMYIRFLALCSVLLTRFFLQSSRWINRSLVICRRSRNYAQAKGYFMLLIPALILTLIVLAGKTWRTKKNWASTVKSKGNSVY